MVEAAARQLAAGTMLDDKYRIERLLAVGGMGAVYVGTHVKLRKKVAIKVLNPTLTSDAMITRFHREAITASQIGHEGIAQVTDLGTSTDGEPFLVMELLEGESLASRLKAAGALPIELACELSCAILSPVAAAHAAGIVHRDLKPDNVFLVRQSRGEMIKLLDFGISRAQGLEGDMRLTNTGVVMGTPYYMSPEQARGESDVTAAADIYSIGVILYEMLVGHVPITGENYNQLIWRVMNAEYESPRLRRPDIPVELEQLVVRAMALDASQRPTAQALEQALLAFCRPTYREHMIERMSKAGIPWGTPAPHRASQPSPPMLGTDPTLLAPSDMHRSRASRLRWLLLAAVLVGGGVAALVATQSSSKPNEAQAKVDSPAPTPAVAPTPSSAVAPTPSSAVAPTPSPASPPPSPVPPPSQPAQVTIHFVVTPQDAQVLLDGKPASGSYIGDAQTGDHELSVSAPGYVSHSQTLSLLSSQTLRIELQKEPRHTTRRTRPNRLTRPGTKRTQRIEDESPYR